MALDVFGCSYLPYQHPYGGWWGIIPPSMPQQQYWTWTPIADVARVAALEAQVVRLERQVKRLRRAQSARQKREQ